MPADDPGSISTRLLARLLAGATLALVLATAFPGTASAHTDGKVQLWVEGMALRAEGAAWALSVNLIDADSGTPQPGFDVAAEGSDGAGHSLAPVLLNDAGEGRYTAPLPIGAGRWTLQLRADTRPGGAAAIPLRRTYPLALEAGKDVTIGSPSPARADPGAPLLPTLNIQIERADKEGRSPLWVPVRVKVTEGDNGAALRIAHIVFAAARNDRDDEAGPFELGSLELEGPAGAGVHEGFVIVPYGGTWTITAAVDGAKPASGPAPLLGRARAEVAVDAPIPPAHASAAGAADGTGGRPAEPFETFVLWSHTMVAILWGAGVALLALLAVPAGRRFLSEAGTARLDGRLGRIAATTWWLTALVVGTGVYNLVNSVPYRVPLSPDEASRLFRLPYAKPYYLVLALKLAAYAVMMVATLPLIREARRRAGTITARGGGTLSPDDEPSPWDTSGGAVAVRPQRPTETMAPTAPDGKRATLLTTVMVAGAVLIIAAVTLLKYFHLLGEVSRLAS